MIPIAILDNQNATFDRYTFVFYNEDDGTYPYWGSSDSPFHPQGFGQYGGDFTRQELDNYLQNPPCDEVVIAATELPEKSFEFYKQLCTEDRE